MAQRRTKEIGVRKVLGASVTGIVGLLSKDFVVPVLVAFGVAAPVAYWTMDEWLQNFAYHIAIDPVLLIGAGIGTLAVALLTVSYHGLRAALADPVKALRSE